MMKPVHRGTDHFCPPGLQRPTKLIPEHRLARAIDAINGDPCDEGTLNAQDSLRNLLYDQDTITSFPYDAHSRAVTILYHSPMDIGCFKEGV